MVSHRPFQRLQPLSLLAQLISRRVDGCLQIVSGSVSWLLYLDEGTLAFATNSIQPFERLDRVLDQLSDRVPSLIQFDRGQLRQFETVAGTYPAISADYQAIEWLLGQRLIDRSQAAALIELLAIDVIKPFLSVTEGIYEVIAKPNFLHYPNLCQLDLRPIVERCHSELKSHSPAIPKATSPDASIPLPSPVSSAPSARPLSFTTSQPAISQPTQTPVTAVPTGSAPTSSVAATAQVQYKIACIDDSPTVLQAISTFLNDSSVSVIMINDPVKALMQIVRSKPDIILLDVGMPNLDGYELCSLLRRHPSFKLTPIIMVTGHTGFIDRAKAKIAGASGYLTKPFTQSELVKTVFRYLE
ncbi:response regulator receiver domain protein [Leptolyngbya boryana NIES-2135]|jgi:chemotaxis family two-component system response regulator PixG|uniref:Response regulator receiver domain protein n=1 Tax=Leptolyngbya boryana NIES-2135 TaxID=1973484 RepID=A0A1Z4JQC4_LEPBY|nr:MULTISPECIES: response regulator [Leptolyngbya]BAY58975.1 response regulator receiver domain protein [Leptolyngbya boryana NIES-2135]MBD2368274.1 response regulator [Leptolyngbya sp. FACHB-161]MBD2374686.1 response regulator [Leptolyngbya sp. FACHB-238]MBD2399108.1 response regulator [Leptolyngbya sp. FACHB-239]MBD2405114.1 response regulator [Leptolyngbya sp. FACHB-402]